MAKGKETLETASEIAAGLSECMAVLKRVRVQHLSTSAIKEAKYLLVDIEKRAQQLTKELDDITYYL
jgi:hypothetical protein